VRLFLFFFVFYDLIERAF